ncbi:MAG TPA: response regulator [Candidatus Angelobacter sp.]
MISSIACISPRVNKNRVLLVDDEASIRLTLGTILQLRGYEVTAVGTVPEALAAIQGAPYDVLVSDLNIGQPYDGFMIASAMRRVQPGVVNVMITGYPAFESALESIRQQIDDYLVKPTDVDELVDLIEGKLQARKLPPTAHHKRAVQVVHDNRDAIIQRWMSTVEADEELAAVAVNKSQRKGHLPQFLDALVVQIEAHEPQVSQIAMDAAAMHGTHRFKLGYSIPLVIREATMLETAIFELLQERLLEIKISRFFSDVCELSRSINQQLETSIRAYLSVPASSAALKN